MLITALAADTDTQLQCRSEVNADTMRLSTSPVRCFMQLNTILSVSRYIFLFHLCTAVYNILRDLQKIYFFASFLDTNYVSAFNQLLLCG